MTPILLLSGVILTNGVCLGLLMGLRTRAHRASERHQAFATKWRPILMQRSLGQPSSLPVDASTWQNDRERFWFLKLWTDMHQSMRGESGERLNALLDELELRPQVLSLLQSKHPSEQIIAVQALGYLQDPQAWNPLVKLALEADSMLAFQALRALLVLSSEAALPVMIEVLKTHRDWSRARLLGTLRRIPSPRLVEPLGEALLVALREEDIPLAKDLTLLLGVLRYPGTLHYLREVLAQVKAPQLLEICAGILGEMRDPAALEPIQALVMHEEASVRQQAVRSLGMLAGPAQIPVLLSVLGDGDWWVVYRAVEALHRIPGIRPEKLGELYQHPLSQVRDAMHYYQESANLNEIPY
jgi:HEAT repeat protein